MVSSTRADCSDITADIVAAFVYYLATSRAFRNVLCGTFSSRQRFAIKMSPEARGDVIKMHFYGRQ